MDQFDAAYGHKTDEPTAELGDKHAGGLDLNQVGPSPHLPNGQPVDLPTPAPFDWTAAPREVLQGLTEELPETANDQAPASEPAPHAGPPLTAVRKTPQRQQRPARERPSRPAFTLEQRLLILDSWHRSGLPGTEFAPL